MRSPSIYFPFVVVLLTMIRNVISFVPSRSPLLSRKKSMTSARLRQQKKLRAKKVNPYAGSVILPTTDFNQRANAIVREPELQEYWKNLDLHNKLSSSRRDEGAPTFTLHDGPPYANGDLHIGHAMNKILKDFLNRRQLAKGFNVNYVPGWDTHGLPIELKVLQSMKSKERQSLTPITLREKAAEFAKETVAKQSASFQRYGIFGDFENPYLTLQPDFEAAQIRVFGEMFKKGHLYRGRKPVHWSPSSRTALAEAELEYPDKHFSRSIYVGFPIESATDALSSHADAKVAIWTTTPWTMPANLAVAVNPDLDYSVVTNPTTGKLIVATDLASKLAVTLKLSEENASFETLATLKGSDLVGTTYKHPLYDRISPVLAGGDYITTESGTGLVHTAPGHGQEDYLTGMKNGLELLSPVDDAGRFTEEAGERFVGKDVLGDGNLEAIIALSEVGALLMEEKYQHKYPYDWRTKKPTIFRATSQWFCSIDGFKDAAMDAIDTVEWVPSVGKNRITSFVSGRSDWCISRQRSWGVPIPVFYDDSGENTLINDETIAHIEKIFAEHGSDAWWTMSVEELLPESLKSKAGKWTKGTDTMDVWFDSGSSWAGVVGERENLHYPADVYLEGSDQHRGWFQSSLLTSVAAQGVAPYKSVITHGFVLDEKGYKMSKSLGNVVSPLEIIEGGNNKKQKPAYGVDVLRLWVASVDYSGDVRVGDGIIKQIFESYRKLRNTARFMLGNVDDFDVAANSVPYEELPDLDKYMLGKLSEMLKDIDEAYSRYDYSAVVQSLLRFSTADLSNFYLDVAKDRLYISHVDDFRRRSAQTVISKVLDGFAMAIAPILPHMAEDIHLNRKGAVGSVFEKTWPTDLEGYEKHDDETWDLIRRLRDDANKALEIARVDKVVGASLDAQLVVGVDDEAVRAKLESFLVDEAAAVDQLKYMLMMSQITLKGGSEVKGECGDYVVEKKDGLSGLTVGVKKAAGEKCERCWFYDEDTGVGDDVADDLCPRCDGVTKKIGFVKAVSGVASEGIKV